MHNSGSLLACAGICSLHLCSCLIESPITISFIILSHLPPNTLGMVVLMLYGILMVGFASTRYRIGPVYFFVDSIATVYSQKLR